MAVMKRFDRMTNRREKIQLKAMSIQKNRVENW